MKKLKFIKDSFGSIQINTFNDMVTALQAIQGKNISYFMGMSLMRANFFSKQMVSHYIDKFATDSTPFILLIADSLEDINYRYLHDYSMQEAQEKSKLIGENFLRGYYKLKHNYPNFYPILTSEIEKLKEYNIFKEIVFQFFNINRNFRYAVQKEVITNIGDRSQNKLSRSNKEPPRIEKYVLKEIAISLFLYSQSVNSQIIQVSPNPHSILANLSNYGDLLFAFHIDESHCNYNSWYPGDISRVAS